MLNLGAPQEMTDRALETLRMCGMDEQTARDSLRAAQRRMKELPGERSFELMVELFGYRGAIAVSFLLSELFSELEGDDA